MRRKLLAKNKKHLKKVKPAATVFFRFSHRDEHKNALSVTEQKEKVKSVITSIMAHHARLQDAMIDEIIENGPKILAQHRSKTFMNYFDAYSSIPTL